MLLFDVLDFVSVFFFASIIGTERNGTEWNRMGMGFALRKNLILHSDRENWHVCMVPTEFRILSHLHRNQYQVLNQISRKNCQNPIG